MTLFIFIQIFSFAAVVAMHGDLYRPASLKGHTQ
jgi:hypothetical protein